MKKIVVIDGQGGKIGRLVVEQIKASSLVCEIYAIGTNSIATGAMLKAGADFGATGENPVIVNCRDADVIIGPIGILIADALHGEVTANMVLAVGRSAAHKILLPVNRCNTYIPGSQPLPPGDLVALAVAHIGEMLQFTSQPNHAK